MFVRRDKRVSASRFPHTAGQGKEQFVASAPKASDKRFDYTRMIKCANRAEERVLRKQRTARVIGILDKSAAAINAELAREAAEAERLSRDFWRNFKRQVKQEETQSPQKRKPQIEEDEPPIWFRKLPSYDHDIVDSMGLTGVFAEFKYLSAPRTSYGVAKRLVYYITKPESIEYLHDGSPAVLSNVGVDRDENATFMSMLEDVHRGSRANAKIVVSAILQLPYEVTTETRLDIMREWCEQNLGVHDLPYVAGLHPPSREGDQRNYHAHVIFSYRPKRQHGRYDWDLNRFLRTDLDDPHFFTILRSNFAQAMTEHVQKAGIDRIYTSLSNAARGIVHKPVPKLKPHIVRVFRDGGYVMDVERTKALIAMNTRREMAYEALRNKVLEEIEARFDDLASGAYDERHRPRPFVPLPAAQLGLPQRDRAIGEAGADAPHPASLQLPRPSKSVATPPTPKLLCPKPAAMPIESAPKAVPKLPVAIIMAEAPPAPSHKFLLPVRAVMPPPPTEQRVLMRMAPAHFSETKPVSHTLFLPARANSVPGQSEPARLMLPAKVVPSSFTHTQPKLPKAADWSMLPAHAQTTVLKCPVAAYPVPTAADAPTFKIIARAYLPQTLRSNAALLRPSQAQPVPVKVAQPEPTCPVAAVIPPPPSRQSPLRLTAPTPGYDC
jgi:hypothetical protein